MPCSYLLNINESIICTRLERTDDKMSFTIALSLTKTEQQKLRHAAHSAHTGVSQYGSNVNR